MSPWYDLIVGEGERRLALEGLGLLAPGAGERVLEVGFGTGHAAVEIARAVGERGRYAGVDISPGMLREATGRLETAGLSSRAELSLGDAADTACEDGSFDAVFTAFTLELFDVPDIPRVLAGCRRALRPGGRLCVVSMSKGDGPSAMLRLYEWAHRNFERWVDCRPIRVRQSVEAAGFQVAEARLTKAWGLPMETVLARKPAAAEARRQPETDAD
jgi:demethylmenaquinone methyltransferase/2-methoxy-6-polyprenyl-1,4-benzoquinol methylase